MDESKRNTSAYIIQSTYRHVKDRENLKSSLKKLLNKSGGDNKVINKKELQKRIKTTTEKLLIMKKTPRFYDTEDFESVENAIRKLKEQYKTL